MFLITLVSKEIDDPQMKDSRRQFFKKSCSKVLDFVAVAYALGSLADSLQIAIINEGLPPPPPLPPPPENLKPAENPIVQSQSDQIVLEPFVLGPPVPSALIPKPEPEDIAVRRKRKEEYSGNAVKKLSIAIITKLLASHFD